MCLLIVGSDAGLSEMQWDCSAQQYVSVLRYRYSLSVHSSHAETFSSDLVTKVCTNCTPEEHSVHNACWIIQLEVQLEGTLASVRKEKAMIHNKLSR